MGNSESSNPIRNLDKRTARREYKASFVAAIERYRQNNPVYNPNRRQQSNDCRDNQSWSNGDIKVFVRKRPIFDHEIKAGEFDVTSTSNNRIVVHDARMHADMKRQMMHHYEFEFDHVFHEKSTNGEVYEKTAKPLIEIACKGGFATALVYGQTGSGKTFTMSSIYTQAANAIFEELHNNVERFEQPPTVSVSFIEIAGDQIHDLLNAFNHAQLRTANDGSVHAFPLVEPIVSNAEQLLSMIQHGLNIRTTAATGVHDTSSRSHAMLRIYIQRNDLVGSGTFIEGVLTLVDLAGSEHRIDSMYHGKERRKETSQINASLMALKECIRARALGILNTAQHIYRKSKLTMALKDSFNLPEARTIVISTVSPASKDTEHSLNTLRHANIMQGQDGSNNNNNDDNDQNGEETRFTTGGKVFTEVIGEVNIAAIARKNQQYKKEHHGEVVDLKTSNGNMIDNKEKQKNNNEAEMTDKMKNKLRRMSEAKSFNALAVDIKELLKKYRTVESDLQWRRIRNSNINTYQVDDTVVASSSSAATNSNTVNEPTYPKWQYNGIAVGNDTTNATTTGSKQGPSRNEISPTTSNSASKQPSKQHPTILEQQDTEESNEYDEDFEHSPLYKQTNKQDQKQVNRKSVDSNNMLSMSNTPPRIDFHTLYQAIFLPSIVSLIPKDLLVQQLVAILQVHQYSPPEIDYYITNIHTFASNSNRGHSQGQSRNQGQNQPSDTASVYSSATNTTSNTNTSNTNHMRPRTPTNPVLSARNNTSNTNNNSSTRPSSASRPMSASRRQSSSAIQSTTSSTTTTANRRSSTPNRVSSTNTAAVTNSSSKPRSSSNSTTSNANTSGNTASYKTAQQQVDEEADLRRQRQLAAKQHRETQEQQKLQQLQQKVSQKTSSKQGNTKANKPPVIYNDEVDECNQHIERLTEEVQRLTEVLETDKALPNTVAYQESKLSMAKKYSIKKQLSLAKAELIRQERRKQLVEQGLPVEIEPPAKSAGSGGNVGTSINSNIRTARELEIGIEQCLAENSRLAKQQQLPSKQPEKGKNAPNGGVDLRYSMYDDDENQVNDQINDPIQPNIPPSGNAPVLNKVPPPNQHRMVPSSSNIDDQSDYNMNSQAQAALDEAFISDYGRPIMRKNVPSANNRNPLIAPANTGPYQQEYNNVQGNDYDYNYQQPMVRSNSRGNNNIPQQQQYQQQQPQQVQNEHWQGRRIDYNESNYTNNSYTTNDVTITTNRQLQQNMNHPMFRR